MRLAVMLARHSIHTMQTELGVLTESCVHYARGPSALIAASHMIAVELATIAAANNH